MLQSSVPFLEYSERRLFQAVSLYDILLYVIERLLHYKHTYDLLLQSHDLHQQSKKQVQLFVGMFQLTHDLN